MAIADADGPSLAWRMRQAEHRLGGLDAGFATQVSTIVKQDRDTAVIKSEVASHTHAIDTLGGKLDKVYWALIGLSTVIATSAGAVIFTLGGSHP